MKKITVLCACIVFFSFFSNLGAHPPSNIKISFDSDTKMLNAAIEHNTGNILNHFIITVAVELNGAKILSHTFSKQDNPIGQEVAYLIPDAKKGDVISVEATCSVRGKLKKSLEVIDSQVMESTLPKEKEDSGMRVDNLIFVLGITNIVFGLLVLFSCRCMMGTFIKKLYNFNWYKKFYKYHCYYWWLFFLSVFFHAFLALHF